MSLEGALSFFAKSDAGGDDGQSRGGVGANSFCHNAGDTFSNASEETNYAPHQWGIEERPGSREEGRRGTLGGVGGTFVNNEDMISREGSREDMRHMLARNDTGGGTFFRNDDLLSSDGSEASFVAEDTPHPSGQRESAAPRVYRKTEYFRCPHIRYRNPNMRHNAVNKQYKYRHPLPPPHGPQPSLQHKRHFQNKRTVVPVKVHVLLGLGTGRPHDTLEKEITRVDSPPWQDLEPAPPPRRRMPTANRGRPPPEAVNHVQWHNGVWGRALAARQHAMRAAQHQRGQLNGAYNDPQYFYTEDPNAGEENPPSDEETGCWANCTRRLCGCCASSEEDDDEEGDGYYYYYYYTYDPSCYHQGNLFYNVQDTFADGYNVDENGNVFTYC
ncbi:hypothetical protein AGDE_16364 [Angomonas deanei]|nr:hypothetical protein AGDE_16364 [Angomonas deanei]|eukprot:EPY17209.1 hypothetical protein AGDE_16364 [Angomonas deanei]